MDASVAIAVRRALTTESGQTLKPYVTGTQQILLGARFLMSHYDAVPVVDPAPVVASAVGVFRDLCGRGVMVTGCPFENEL